MSAKSAGHTEVHTRGLVSRKVVLLAVIAVVAMFFTVITFYPLIFSSQKQVPTAPVTNVK